MTTWFNHSNDAVSTLDTHQLMFRHNEEDDDRLICPSCAHPIQNQFQLRIQGSGFEDWWRLPAGVKFDPSDEEILKHLEAKVKGDKRKLHPLIDDFIPTLDGDDGICYTHPQNLPGMRNDGEMRHYFHRPSKAYTAGTRKRRKVVQTEGGSDIIRWHKTGKTRPIRVSRGGVGVVIGFKKILVLYSNNNNNNNNYGKKQLQRKPQKTNTKTKTKTNWIMHQYHLGISEQEKDGQLVASKLFFQKHPRQTQTQTSHHIHNPPIIQQFQFHAAAHNSPETTAVPIMSSSSSFY